MNDGVLLAGRKPTARLLPTPWPHLFVREGFAPRETFSASQLSTAGAAGGCDYLWGLQYLLGLRTREPQWYGPDGRTENTDLAKRERSLAFGTALHAKLEAHFRGEPVDWTDDVGQRALAGLHFLPSAPPVFVEQEIQLDLTEYSAGLVDPKDPISFVGFKDLCTPAEGGAVVGKTYDYKTTGNMRWKKTPAQLQSDLAANLYLADDMQRYGLRIRDGRWVCFASTGTPHAEAVDFVILYEETIPIIRAAIVQALGLRRYVRDHQNGLLILNDQDVKTKLPLIRHLPMRLGHCKAYSGCPMHFSASGPCTAETTPGAAVEHEDFSNVTETKPTKEDPITMATLAERIAAQQAVHAQGPAAQPAAAPAAHFPPGVSPPNFNPSAGAFPAPGPAATGFAPGVPAAAPAFAPPPVVPPTAPVAPFAGFGGAPAAAAPQTPAQGFGNPPGWTGVNPPEQALAGAPNPGAPMPPAAQQPGPDVAPASPAIAGAAAPKKRGPKPRQPAAPATFPAGFAPTTTVVNTAAEDSLLTVTIRVTDGSGCAIEIPCPTEWAEMIAQHLGPKFNTLEA